MNRLQPWRARALLLFVFLVASVGCGACPYIYKIPNVRSLPPALLAASCPGTTTTPPATIPRLCRNATPSDCTAYAAPAGATLANAKCDDGVIAECPGIGECSFQLATNSECYVGESRYCDLKDQTCDPSTSLAGCGTQPCSSGGSFWVVDECDPLTVSCGTGGLPCCSANECYDGFVCASGKCASCGVQGAPCCTNGACASGLTCSNGTCEPTPVCGQTPGAPCCLGSKCNGALVCASGKCVDCGGSGKACCDNGACNPGLTCESGQCAAVVCSPGAKDCAGTNGAPRTCKADGSGYTQSAPCDSSSVCQGGQCVSAGASTLHWKIVTGTDDLRGASSTAILDLIDGSGNTLSYYILNGTKGDQGWANGSSNEGDITVSADVASRISQLWVHLRQGACALCSSDNWEVATFNVTAKNAAGTKCLVQRTAAPYVARLTESTPYAKFPAGSGCP